MNSNIVILNLITSHINNKYIIKSYVECRYLFVFVETQFCILLI